jgi:putative DNA methylase
MPEYRRRLPHLQPGEACLFVTWRLHGSIPTSVLRGRFPTPGHAFAASDRALAQDQRHLWLRDPRIARLLSEAIRAGQTERQFYELEAWVVMPNHVHLLVRPSVAVFPLRAQVAHQSAITYTCWSGPVWLWPGSRSG